MNKLISKWRSLYVQKQIRDISLEQYTNSYITDKLVPMWPKGWMKYNDIHSHFMSKIKAKELKKPSNDLKLSKQLSTSNTSSSVTVSIENNSTIMADKKKIHISKESSKSIKVSNEKPITMHKTEKQHIIVPTERPIVSSVLSVPIGDTLNTKSVKYFIIF